MRCGKFGSLIWPKTAYWNEKSLEIWLWCRKNAWCETFWELIQRACGCEFKARLWNRLKKKEKIETLKLGHTPTRTYIHINSVLFLNPLFLDKKDWELKWLGYGLFWGRKRMKKKWIEMKRPEMETNAWTSHIQLSHFVMSHYFYHVCAIAAAAAVTTMCDTTRILCRKF